MKAKPHATGNVVVPIATKFAKIPPVRFPELTNGAMMNCKETSRHPLAISGGISVIRPSAVICFADRTVNLS